MFFVKGDLQLPHVPITMTPVSTPCKVGAEIGWVGFPTIEPDQLCFFSGTVSAHRPANNAYLIDGVAINGVSGGPVFHWASSGQVQMIGSVSAYHANRATGEALPGLLRAQDVSHFSGVAAAIRNIDEGREQKAKFEARKDKDVVDPFGDDHSSSSSESGEAPG